MNPVTPLSPDQLSANFADLHPPYSRDQAAVEAGRCLFCFDAPCMRACPTHIDVPRFIRQILHDNTAGAAETIFTENIFGGSCARACPTEVLCEGACVDRTLLKEPVQIGRLQRFATDHAMAREMRFFEPAPATGRKVAIIGSGPAGLSCAHELRCHGHAVTVFEARDVPGGLNTLGIASYKISTDFALAELGPILDIGIDLRLNSPVSALMVPELMATHDAVFLAIGLGATARLGLPGEDLAGVWEALEFVFQTHTGPLSHCRVGESVVVIGAGNTAIDCATEAVRLGATSVTIAYRRTAADMSAYAFEYELAKADGVAFSWNARPAEFIGDGGRLTGVRFAHDEATEMIIPCDMAIKALGQLPLADFIRAIPGLNFERGRLLTEPGTGWTGVAGLYAGGDCTSKGAEIVNAVQEGKLAARAISRSFVAAPHIEPVQAV